LSVLEDLTKQERAMRIDTHVAVLPPPGLYPEIPLIYSIPDGEWKCMVVGAVVQVCVDGLILCCPPLFSSDGTSIPEWLPIAKEGPWSTASLVHDGTFCTGTGWRLMQNGGLECMHITRKQADEAWRQGHYTKRYTAAAGPKTTAAHWAAVHAFDARRWWQYRRDQHSEQHKDRVAALIRAGESCVWRLLTEGVASVEDNAGYARIA
jgi:hypothetical protein